MQIVCGVTPETLGQHRPGLVAHPDRRRHPGRRRRLADEPTAALDKDSAADVVDLLRRMGAARGTTTLLVTHDNRILDRADRILTIEDGTIVRSEERGG